MNKSVPITERKYILPLVSVTSLFFMWPLGVNLKCPGADVVQHIRQGRKLRLDEDAEQKLLAAAKSCNWKPPMFELFRDVIILARDTGMRNGRELYRIRTKNLDWNNRIIFVPDSKTVDGRRMIPISDRAYEVLRVRAAGKTERWLFPSARSRCGHLTDLGKQFRIAPRKAQLSEDLVLYCARQITGQGS